MNLNMRDWILALVLTSVVNTIIANLIGNQTSIVDSIPGVLILSLVSVIGIFLGKVLPIKLPGIVFVAVVGLLVASPISPIAKQVIDYTAKISFMAPLTVVGTLAGIGLDYNSFKKQSGKMLIIALLVFTGTFLVQASFAEFFLRMTHAI